MTPDKPLTEADRLLSAEELAKIERRWRNAYSGDESALVAHRHFPRLLSHIRALEADRVRLRGALEQIATYWDHLIEGARPDDALVELARAALNPDREAG